MNKKETRVIHKCECGCSMLVVEKTVWENGEIDHDISIQDSRYDHNNTTILGRIKGALKILFGKPVYYSDVYIGKPEDFKALVEKLYLMCMDIKKTNLGELMIEDYRFVLTCTAAPEIYDVFDFSGKQVGYVRLRHGELRCDYPEYHGETIYYSEYAGESCFRSNNERDFHLKKIALCIKEKMSAS